VKIENKVASRRSPVRSDQAQLFAILTRDLIQANERYASMSLDAFFQLGEYRKFVLSAYACGFVCDDYSSEMKGAGFEAMKQRPQEHLGSCSFSVLRHWVHVLLRAERWAQGWSSHVREAIESGALAIVAGRLEEGAPD